MPNADFTSDTNWTVPFAVTSIDVTVIGGGGGGGGDTGSGTDGGGGGGGGGFRRVTNIGVSEGQSVNINTGRGGNGETDGRAQSGGDTTVSSSSFSVNATGGQGGSTSDGGNGGNPNGQDGQREYSDSDARAGGGGGAGNAGGNSGRGNGVGSGCFAAGGEGGDGTSLDGGDNGNGGDASCGNLGGRNGGNFGGGGGGGSQGSRGGQGGIGAARISFNYQPPTVFLRDLSQNGDPTTYTSSSGTPEYSATLQWGSTYATSVSISGIGGVSANDTRTITGPQSTAGSNSPASVTYTITATGPGGSVTDTHTFQFYNDNSPSSISVSNVVSPGSLSRTAGVLEPNTYYDVTISFSGTDMPCRVQTSDSNLSFNSSGSSVLVSANSNITARFLTPPFNTSTTVGGTNANGLAIGQTNSRTYNFTIGSSGNQSFTVVTRAPVIQELFNAEGPLDAYPHPDIDTVANPNTDPYIRTGVDVTCGDIEIPVELKTSDGNVQANINQSNNWQNLRQI